MSDLGSWIEACNHYIQAKHGKGKHNSQMIQSLIKKGFSDKHFRDNEMEALIEKAIAFGGILNGSSGAN